MASAQGPEGVVTPSTALKVNLNPHPDYNNGNEKPEERQGEEKRVPFRRMQTENHNESLFRAGEYLADMESTCI